MSRRWIFIVVGIILVVCVSFISKQSPVNYKTYKITKGTHRVSAFPKLSNKRNLKYQVLFDSTCQYTCVNPVNQLDINKLFGFSDCSSHHHSNSARFGWRYYEGKIDLFAYVYKDGGLSKDFLASVPLNVPCDLHLYAQDKLYTTSVKSEDVEVNIQVPRSQKKGIWSYHLWPYFGGDEVAPKDIVIHMKRV